MAGDRDLDLDALDDEEYLRAWAAADRRAADVLAQAIPDVLASDPPMDELAPAAERVRSAVAARTEEGRYFETACGWAAPPDLDGALWLQAAGSTISPWEDPDTDPELQAAVFSLEYADWLALIVGLVRRGVGAELSAELMVEDLEAMPEIEIDELPEESDLDLALEILVPLWQVLGALDAGRRLTALGRWGLPRALHLVWSTSGDDDTSSDDPLEELERLEPRGSRLDDEATETAIELLRTGPMTLAQLRSACGGSGVFTDEGTLYRSIIWRSEVWALEDDRFLHLPSVADGLVLTHRLTAQELELSILDPRVDLELYSLIAEEGLPLEGGGTLVAVHAGGPEQMPAGWICKLTGPDGWLAGRAAGDLIGLRLTDGVVSMETIDETTDDDRPELLDIARSVARLADPVNRHGLEGVTSDDIVMMARAERPDVLSRPGPPLSEVLSHSGLEEHLGEYGVPGTRWYGEPPLAADQRVAYYAWRDALRAFEHGAEPREEDLEAALGLAGLTLDLAATDAALHAPCAPLLEQLLRRAEGAAAAGPLYLLAREAEARLDGPVYVALLEQAVAADSSLEDAVADLAEVRAIQGDAAAAHRLFGLAGVDASYPDRAALGPFLRAPEGETGRNRPCPCGSGKKYKVCHGRDARHPLADRGRWLWVKIKSFAQRSINRDELFGWAELLSGEDRDDDAIARAMDDPTTWDFAVFDGDILARFLTLYGDLLPADEAALARTWQGTPRRLLEVGSTHLNGVSARDMVTNATVELRDRTLPRSVERGTLLLGRFLDPGDGALQPWDDPLGIPRMWRPRVLAALRSGADPRDLAALLAPSGPPELVTTDGEELLFCVARYRVDDLDAAWASLATVLSGDEDTLHLGGDDNGAPIRGTVTHDAGLLVLQTMSIERMRSLQEVLVAAAPDAVLVDESSRTMADVPDRGPGTAGAPIALSPADLAAIVRATEDRWIEDSIPALGGRTPRQTASDPALRGELLDLLNDIEITQRGADFAMDTDRVRRELGL
ncbi:SEC-C domain-containing protein [Nocardioides sp.]|uniref:SEC-C domain-containing protein n=1 Tax=Nocardioides sp. TaxID=35761 RepID=UPI0025E45356|nr:SEC-C domain-containing protein [Nocardioides sp.]